MEQLQSLLRAYNIEHINDNLLAPWNKQFCDARFPKYWEIVFSILQTKDRNSRVIEVGSGLGAITSILCFLNYTYITSFEKDVELANCAEQRIKEMFHRENIVLPVEYPGEKTYNSDILILVNCAYAMNTSTKLDYLSKLRVFYECAGNPHSFILEVIDDSYSQLNDEFPMHIRLNRKDIYETFPNTLIKSWVSYKYPINEKSKTLYLIERL